MKISMPQAATASLITLLLTGCADDPYWKSRNTINANNATLASAAERAQNRAPQTARVSTSPNLYLGEEVVELGRGVPLPPGLPPVDVTFLEAVPMSFVAKALSEQVGYPVVSLMGTSQLTVRRLQGDLGSVLQQLATNSGIGYEHRNGVVMLIPAGVEIVPIPTPLMPVLQAATTRSGGRNGGSQASQQTNSDTTALTSEKGLKTWIEKLASLNNSLPYPGAQIATHPELGVISIRGPAAAMPNIKRMVEERLAQIRTPTRIVIRFLSVALGNERTFQANLDSVYGSLFGQPARLIGNSTSTAFNLLRATPTGIKADTLEAAISTIAQRNHVVSNQRFDVTLMPGFVKKIADVQRITYIRDQGSTSNTATTTTSITQDEVVVGTQGQIVAMPSSKSRVTVGYAFSISQLLGPLNTVTSGSVLVQQPNTSEREINDQADLASGDTIVISSQVIDTARSSGAGAVSANAPVPGNLAGSSSYQLAIVLLSAELVSPTQPNRDPSTDNILRVAGGDE